VQGPLVVLAMACAAALWRWTGRDRDTKAITAVADERRADPS
jgi:hypothetical protein